MMRILLIAWILLISPKAVHAEITCTWKDAVALPLLNAATLAICMGTTIPIALQKKRSLNEEESNARAANTIFENNTQIANHKRNQIVDAQIEISNLDCAAENLVPFQDHTKLICDAQLNGLEVYQAEDSTSSSSEPIYRTEYYQEQETYYCYRPYQTTCVDSKQHVYTCTRYRYETCWRTVTRSRQVFDYTRTTDVFDMKAGAAIRGQNRAETGCGRYNATLGFSSQEEFLGDTWDRSDRTHYKNWRQYTTSLFHEFTFDGKSLSQESKLVVNKMKSLNETALAVVRFISNQCALALPVITKATVNNYEQKKNTTMNNLIEYLVELPSLEAAEAQAKNDSEHANDKRAQAESEYNTARGISIGVTIGLFAGVNLIYVITKTILGSCHPRTCHEPVSIDP